MRLIDADKMIKDLTERYEDNLGRDVILKLIGEQPEAYNAEKVVEELEKESINAMLPNGFREPCVTLKTAETILKAGGIDEIN